jgi:uncharacterized protein (TIGR03435 family)
MPEKEYVGKNQVHNPSNNVDAQPGEAWGDRVRDAVIALGFKVETRKVPLELTVVDRCDRPSEN